MSESYVNCLMHVIFGTKDRTNLIRPDIRHELFPMMATILKERKCRAIQIGGTEDHVHILLSLPPTITLANAVQTVKGISSKWLNENKCPGFRWQRGYGAFSVSLSNKEKVAQYIKNQEAHHRKMDFRTEFIAYLKQHDIPYDPRFI